MPIANVGMGRAPWRLPTYTGTAEIFGTKDKGYMVIKSSGTLVFPGSGTIERVQMGSGLAGATASSMTGQAAGGAGGAGGGMWTRAAFKVKRNEEYQITIAAACSSTTDANITSSFGGDTTPDGRGASGGTRGSATSTEATNAGNGGDGNKTPWSGSNPIPALGSFCAGGGGGGAWIRVGNEFHSARAGTGGSPGGGNGGKYSTSHTSAAGYDASPNTASGGGGGGRHYGEDPIVRGVGGKGGSGLVIIRWGYV